MNILISILLIYVLSALLFPPIAFLCIKVMSKEEQLMFEEMLAQRGVSISDGIMMTRFIPILNTIGILYFLYYLIKIIMFK